MSVKISDISNTSLLIQSRLEYNDDHLSDYKLIILKPSSKVFLIYFLNCRDAVYSTSVIFSIIRMFRAFTIDIIRQSS